MHLAGESLQVQHVTIIKEIEGKLKKLYNKLQKYKVENQFDRKIHFRVSSLSKFTRSMLNCYSNYNNKW